MKNPDLMNFHAAIKKKKKISEKKLGKSKKAKRNLEVLKSAQCRKCHGKLVSATLILCSSSLSVCH